VLGNDDRRTEVIMRGASMLCLLGVIAVHAVSPRAAAESRTTYLPLAQDCTWSYTAQNGSAETQTVVGQRVLFGSAVTVIDYSQSTANEGLENYWTTESDGDVLLWGFFRDGPSPWGQLYQPPIRVLDAPLFVGETWSGETFQYDLPDTIPAGSLTWDFRVYGEGQLTVPAGTFDTFGVGPDSLGTGGPARAGFSLSGERIGDAAGERSATSWWAPWVGQVQYRSDTTYQLASYSVTPVARATWTTIKALYDRPVGRGHVRQERR
jgi:hypothetical protein